MAPEFEPTALDRTQLGHLVYKRIPFLFLTLVDFAEREINKETRQMLVHAELVSEEELLVQARARLPKAEMPIVLLCETGSASEQQARLLIQAGFINSFYVHGGLDGLQSENP